MLMFVSQMLGRCEDGWKLKISDWATRVNPGFFDEDGKPADYKMFWQPDNKTRAENHICSVSGYVERLINKLISVRSLLGKPARNALIGRRRKNSLMALVFHPPGTNWGSLEHFE